jgi:transcriptional regulator with XRE-family HTH domain
VRRPRVAETASPTVRRRRLASELKQIRRERDLSGQQVADALGWSPAKVSRYEGARTGLKPDEVERLLDFYGITDPRRGQLLGLAHDATRRPWWHEYSDAVSEQYLEFIGYETEASTIEQWAITIVPGLIQTEAYARQIFSNYHHIERVTPAMIDRRVKLRMMRQKALAREPVPQLFFVLDESILIRRLGDDALMHQQLLHIAEQAERPNITVQVYPLQRQFSTMPSSFVVFHFGSERPTSLRDVVSSETLKEQFYIEDEADTYLYQLAYDALAEDALDPGESRELILERARLWSG